MLLANLDFFSKVRTFFAPYQTLCIKKKFYNKSLKLLFIKSHKISKMNYGGGRKTALLQPV